MTDNLDALRARDEFLWIAAQWPALNARLRPGSNGALTGIVVQTSDKPSPIDLHVSDLLQEITETARFYGQVLADETDWVPESSAMPALLVSVVTRYGHFTTDDEAMALGFCDDAHSFHEQVRKTLERPAPPTYIGPCRGRECVGELYIREDREYVRCPECGTTVTREDQRTWLDEQMQDRLMTASEIVRALKILDTPVPEQVVFKWVQRGKLPEVIEGEGLYRLKDAQGLAKLYRPRQGAA